MKKYTGRNNVHTFVELKNEDRIARVQGYKVETAKVINVEKLPYGEVAITVKGLETKQKYSFKVRGKNTTMIGFGTEGPERYYADGSIVPALRDGIEIGFEEARRQIRDTFKPVQPYFTVNGRPVKD